MLTPEQRTLRAKLAANARWSKEDPSGQTTMMRDRFDERFRRQVDPDNSLPSAERERRAQAARKAYFLQLALQSSRSRAQKARRTAETP